MFLMPSLKQETRREAAGQMSRDLPVGPALLMELGTGQLRGEERKTAQAGWEFQKGGAVLENSIMEATRRRSTFLTSLLGSAGLFPLSS
jgi:hypothetical protein